MLSVTSVLPCWPTTALTGQTVVGVELTKENSEMSPTKEIHPAVKEIQIHWISSAPTVCNSDLTSTTSHFSGISCVLDMFAGEANLK